MANFPSGSTAVQKFPSSERVQPRGAVSSRSARTVLPH